MFCAAVGRMLASMSEIDPRAGELGVSGLLPTGTVTLLLADVEGSTRLWETQPEEMTAAIARLNQVVSQTIAEHDGVRPVEQGGVTRLHQARAGLARAARPRSSPPRLNASVARQLVRGSKTLHGLRSGYEHGHRSARRPPQ
jgi:class 3 adenylate cyclase